MIATDTFILFFITTLVVILSPGPAVLSVVLESASNGFKASLAVTMGIAFGNVIFFILSAMGIAALIAASSFMFSIIKWAGVAYLLYLGLSAIFSKSGGISFDGNKNKKDKISKRFLKGLILELSNPKALLYFSALLPQFINIAQPIIPQLIILGLVTLILDLICYSIYAYVAYRSTKHGLKPFTVKIINRTAGTMLIFAGLKMATYSQK